MAASPPRGWAWAAIVALFLLMTMGNIVSATGSGLGCPDWPLCHGRLLAARADGGAHRVQPPAEGHPVHPPAPRDRGADVAADQGARAATPEPDPARPGRRADRTGRRDRALQAARPRQHGAPRERAPDPGRPRRSSPRATGRIPTFPRELERLARAGLWVLLVQLALGGYVRHAGAGLACPDFPLCSGSLLPHHWESSVHWVHRWLGRGAARALRPPGSGGSPDRARKARGTGDGTGRCCRSRSASPPCSEGSRYRCAPLTPWSPTRCGAGSSGSRCTPDAGASWRAARRRPLRTRASRAWPVPPRPCQDGAVARRPWAATGLAERAGAYAELSKFGIVLLVLVSAAAGFMLRAPLGADFPWAHGLVVLARRDAALLRRVGAEPGAGARARRADGPHRRPAASLRPHLARAGPGLRGHRHRGGRGGAVDRASGAPRAFSVSSPPSSTTASTRRGSSRPPPSPRCRAPFRARSRR